LKKLLLAIWNNEAYLALAFAVCIGVGVKAVELYLSLGGM